jgi:hypothetical protein
VPFEDRMARNFHESFDAEAPSMPSARSTGLVFAAVAAIVAACWRETPVVALAALTASVTLGATAWVAPQVLGPLNVAWFRLALLLNRVVSPVVMFVLFALVIVPAGLIMQRRYDPLLKRKPAGRTTYWIERTPLSADMRHQF